MRHPSGVASRCIPCMSDSTAAAIRPDWSRGRAAGQRRRARSGVAHRAKQKLSGRGCLRRSQASLLEPRCVAPRRGEARRRTRSDHARVAPAPPTRESGHRDRTRSSARYVHRGRWRCESWCPRRTPRPRREGRRNLQSPRLLERVAQQVELARAPDERPACPAGARCRRLHGGRARRAVAAHRPSLFRALRAVHPPSARPAPDTDRPDQHRVVADQVLILT